LAQAFLAPRSPLSKVCDAFLNSSCRHLVTFDNGTKEISLVSFLGFEAICLVKVLDFEKISLHKVIGLPKITIIEFLGFNEVRLIKVLSIKAVTIRVGGA